MDAAREGGPLLGAEVGTLLEATLALVITEKLSDTGALGVRVGLEVGPPSLVFAEEGSMVDGRFITVAAGVRDMKASWRNTACACCLGCRVTVPSTQQ